jgi:hypothetical protein
MRLLGIVAALAVTSCASTQDDGLGDLFGSPLKGSKLAAAVATASAYPLGSEQNPVRANMPTGERAYLERLRCSDGNAPTYERSGSVGEGPYGMIMDVYQVECLSGQPPKASIYMDMYHDHVEDRPVPGFTITTR